MNNTSYARSMHTMRRVLVMVRTTTLLIEYACCMHTMDSMHTHVCSIRNASVLVAYYAYNSRSELK